MHTTYFTDIMHLEKSKVKNLIAVRASLKINPPFLSSKFYDLE
jgi:hypothetical protein